MRPSGTFMPMRRLSMYQRQMRVDTAATQITKKVAIAPKLRRRNWVSTASKPMTKVAMPKIATKPIAVPTAISSERRILAAPIAGRFLGPVIVDPVIRWCGR